jgi:hypothetical protein
MKLCHPPHIITKPGKILKAPMAGKITVNHLFFLAKPVKCWYMGEIPGLSAHLGGGNGINSRTCTTANPDQ